MCLKLPSGQILVYSKLLKQLAASWSKPVLILNWLLTSLENIETNRHNFSLEGFQVLWWIVNIKHWFSMNRFSSEIITSLTARDRSQKFHWNWFNLCNCVTINISWELCCKLSKIFNLFMILGSDKILHYNDLLQTSN